MVPIVRDTRRNVWKLRTTPIKPGTKDRPDRRRTVPVAEAERLIGTPIEALADGSFRVLGEETPGTPPSSDTEERRPAPADISEGMAMVMGGVGAVVAERFDPGVGRSIAFTSATSGKLLARGVKKWPGLHALLAIFLGPGKRETAACIGIPVLISRIERNPELLPRALPQLRQLSMPILEDMAEEALEQQKIVARAQELMAKIGPNMTVDHLLMMNLLGMSKEEADRILAGEPVADVLKIPREEPE